MHEYTLGQFSQVFLNGADGFNEETRNFTLGFFPARTDIPWAAVVLYLLFVFWAPKLLRHETDLRLPFMLWNSSLCIFSWMGLYKTLPSFVRTLQQEGFVYSVCHRQEHVRDSTLLIWGLAFTLSKIPELLDTVFLVLSKPRRPVLVLQWYHHSTVLIFSWYAMVSNYAPSFWFVVMNFTVHSFMYFYFALTYFVAPRKIWWFGKCVTIMQTAQMAAGMFISFSSIYFHFFPVQYNQELFSGSRQVMTCKTDSFITYASIVMYTSYFCLFFRLCLKKAKSP